MSPPDGTNASLFGCQRSGSATSSWRRCSAATAISKGASRQYASVFERDARWGPGQLKLRYRTLFGPLRQRFADGVQETPKNAAGETKENVA
jgi:hypothetical protein